MNAISDSSRPSLAKKARLKWDEVRQKNLLLFPEGVLVLNNTACEVLELCDGNRTVAEIVSLLVAKYGNDSIAADIKHVLARLVEKSHVTLTE